MTLCFLFRRYLLWLLLFRWTTGGSASPSGKGPDQQHIEVSAVPFLYENNDPSEETSAVNDDLPQLDDRASSSSDILDVSSCQYYEEGSCLVSSQTLMQQPSSSFDQRFLLDLSSPQQLLEPLLESSDEEEEEEEDDDDDDNDDDGTSSMLSNASLKRRSKVSACGASIPSSPSSSGYSSSSRRHASDDNRPPTSLFTTPNAGAAAVLTTNAGSRAALTLRGGAAASTSLGSEMLKKLFVTALVTVIFEGMIGHILEFLKIVMQTSPTKKTYGQVVRDITAEKGWAGLWDGFCPWGIVQALFKGAVFGLAHSAAKGYLEPLADQGYLPMQVAQTMAGGIGGGFQGYVLSPTLLLKTRVMTNPVFREKMSLLRTTWLSFLIGFEVVRTEGLGTLMKGSNVFATKRVFDWASRYFFSDLFESLFSALKGGQDLSIAEKMAASLCGGIASTCVTLPLDVLVAKTQDAKKAGVKVSAIRLFADELREKGLSGLRDAYMQGFEARLAHVCLTTMVVKTGVPVVYDFLFGTPPTVESSTATVESSTTS